jgi:hypothetical protein
MMNRFLETEVRIVAGYPRGVAELLALERGEIYVPLDLLQMRTSRIRSCRTCRCFHSCCLRKNDLRVLDLIFAHYQMGRHISLRPSSFDESMREPTLAPRRQHCNLSSSMHIMFYLSQVGVRRKNGGAIQWAPSARSRFSKQVSPCRRKPRVRTRLCSLSTLFSPAKVSFSTAIWNICPRARTCPPMDGRSVQKLYVGNRANFFEESKMGRPAAKSVYPSQGNEIVESLLACSVRMARSACSGGDPLRVFDKLPSHGATSGSTPQR